MVGVTVLRGRSAKVAVRKPPCLPGRTSPNDYATTRIRASLAVIRASDRSNHLTTEDLMDEVVEKASSPTVRRATTVYATVATAAELAGTGLPSAVLAEAMKAGRAGTAGLSAQLASGTRVRIKLEKPQSVYIELSRPGATVVIRSEPTDLDVRTAFLHRIDAGAFEALTLLAELAASWPDFGTLMRPFRPRQRG